MEIHLQMEEDENDFIFKEEEDRAKENDQVILQNRFYNGGGSCGHPA